jgi:DNA-binding NarL/FixJ family response regulator
MAGASETPHRLHDELVSAAMADEVRVLVIDDSDVFREGLLALIATVDGYTVIGEADSGERGVERAIELQPDVVLMDLAMPGTDGVSATEMLVRACPHIAVLVLTMDEHDTSVLAAMQAGARGYLLKGARQDELLRAIRTVSEGGAVFGPSIARRLIEIFTRAERIDARGDLVQLTPREHEILELIARGNTNAQIADLLALSRKTVRNHVSNVFSKLDVTNRGAAIVKARDIGLGG